MTASLCGRKAEQQDVRENNLVVSLLLPGYFSYNEATVRLRDHRLHTLAEMKFLFRYLLYDLLNILAPTRKAYGFSTSHLSLCRTGTIEMEEKNSRAAFHSQPAGFSPELKHLMVMKEPHERHCRKVKGYFFGWD